LKIPLHVALEGENDHPHHGLIEYADLQLNYRIFFWGALLAVAFGLLSGVYPAWRMSRLHPVQALKGTSR